MPHISPIQLDFMRLLARVGFATNKHLAQVSIGKNPTKNSQTYLTKRLIEGGLVGRVRVVSGYGIGGRVMYYLTKQGAERVRDIDGDDLQDIQFLPLKSDDEKEIVRADFPHKEKYICFFLALDSHLNETKYSIKKALHYYQKNENCTTLKVNGRNFRPDGIFFVSSVRANDPDFIYVVEIHRHSDRKKIIAQLQNHIEAYKQEAIKERFGANHPYFVLSIFAGENVAVMRSVIDDLKQSKDWAYFEKFFLFGDLNSILNGGVYKSLAYFGADKKPIPL